MKIVHKIIRKLIYTWNWKTKRGNILLDQHSPTPA